MSQNDAPFLPVPFISRDIRIETRPDGSLIVRNGMQLGPLKPHLPALFREAEEAHPTRTFLAKRPAIGAEGWKRVSYRDARRHVDGLTQALLDHADDQRPLLLLSGNSIEHALLTMAAMQARIPAAPIAPAYALRSKDFAKLKSIRDRLDPGFIFVQSLSEYHRALEIFDPARVQVIFAEDPVTGLDALSFERLAATEPGPSVETSVAAITHDTVAKYMFTSGSTNEPKAVITTQKMLCANIAMSNQAIALPHDNPPHVTVDWLPWNHVMGGNSVFGMTLVKQGTLYIDDGKPVPELFGETLRNLREISTSRFANVPAGFHMLVEAMEEDDDLARTFFRDLSFIGYGGSRLADDTYHRFQALAIKQTGHRISFLSGFGATETGPSAMYTYWSPEETGLIGLPLPGADVKLIPIDDERYEVRVKSPGITPGYLGRPDLTEAAFDEEGFFKMGDAATFVDPAHPEEGFRFAGRVSEEFKLQSGTFVRVGELRVKAVDALAPLVLDAVVAGHDQSFVGLLLWPNVQACRTFLGRPEATAAEIIAAPRLREAIGSRIDAYNEANPANSMRIGRAILMAEPLSMDHGEITDKGYINQRKALETRKSAVDALFDDTTLGEAVLTFDKASKPAKAV